MPVMGGEETIKHLKSFPDFKTPVVALTADAMSGAEEKYKGMGFDEYLCKPFSREMIAKKLYSILGTTTQVVTQSVPQFVQTVIETTQPVTQVVTQIPNQVIQPVQTVVTPQPNVVIENMVVNENPVIVNADPNDKIEIDNK